MNEDRKGISIWVNFIRHSNSFKWAKFPFDRHNFPTCRSKLRTRGRIVKKKIKDYPTVDDFVVHRFSSGTGLKASQKICSGQRGKTHKNSGNDVTSFASLMPLSKQISSFFPPLCSVFSFPCTLFSHDKKERKIEGGGERWGSTVKSDEYNEIEREFELIKYLENMWIKSFFFL